MASLFMPLRPVPLPGNDDLIAKQAQCRYTAALACVHFSKSSFASRKRLWLSNPKRGFAPAAVHFYDSDFRYDPLSVKEPEISFSRDNSFESEGGKKSTPLGLDDTFGEHPDIALGSKVEAEVPRESEALLEAEALPRTEVPIDAEIPQEADLPQLTKLFVGNLPWNYDNRQLEDLFKECGSVYVAEVVQERDSGRSRGFGFVYMDKPEDADVAVQKLNDKNVGGRVITVAYPETAEAKSERLSKGDSDKPTNKVFVANLPWITTDDDLHLLFSRFGTVARARVVYDQNTGRSKGFGFVSFSSADEANKTLAAAANGLDYYGRVLKVAPAGEKSSSKSSPF